MRRGYAACGQGQSLLCTLPPHTDVLMWVGHTLLIQKCVHDKEQASLILTLEFASPKGETQKKVTTGAGLQYYRNREPMRLDPKPVVKD